MPCQDAYGGHVCVYNSTVHVSDTKHLGAACSEASPLSPVGGQCSRIGLHVALSFTAGTV